MAEGCPVFYLNGPDDPHVCIRPTGHVADGWVHADAEGVKWYPEWGRHA